MADFRDYAKIEGIAELRKSIKSATGEMKQFRETNKAVAGIVTEAGLPWTPRGTFPKKPGVKHLADTLRPRGTQRAAIASAGQRRPDANYANAIHWGWPARGIKASWWLAISAKATEKKWLAVYEQRILEIISKVKGL